MDTTRNETDHVRASALAALLHSGRGCALVDGSGLSLIDDMLSQIPLAREGDVAIFTPNGTTITGEDLRTPINLFTSMGPQLDAASTKLQASLILSSLSFTVAQSDARLLETLHFGILALLEGEPAATLLRLYHFFSDSDYRTAVLKRVTTAAVCAFWASMAAPPQESDCRADDDPAPDLVGMIRRRLDQYLSDPGLLALSAAHGSSIDVHEIMNRGGIVLADCPVGGLADRPVNGYSRMMIAANLLVTQIIMATMVKPTGVAEPCSDTAHDRSRWLLLLHATQLLFKDRPDLAAMVCAQLRTFGIDPVFLDRPSEEEDSAFAALITANARTRILLNTSGTYISLQLNRLPDPYLSVNLGSLPSDPAFVSMLAGNAQSRLILTAADKGEQGREDLPDAAGCVTLRLPYPTALPLQAVPPVAATWQAIRAAHHDAQDQQLDRSIEAFQALAQTQPDEVVKRLGLLCLHNPAAFDAFCARTKVHRLAQRQFIVENPGCIPVDSQLSGDAATRDQKRRRIRILSALMVGVPKLELDARGYALYTQLRALD